jgi:hypothetical protein
MISKQDQRGPSRTRKGPLTWEPPGGVEPPTYALRVTSDRDAACRTLPGDPSVAWSGTVCEMSTAPPSGPATARPLTHRSRRMGAGQACGKCATARTSPRPCSKGLHDRTVVADACPCPSPHGLHSLGTTSAGSPPLASPAGVFLRLHDRKTPHAGPGWRSAAAERPEYVGRTESSPCAGFHTGAVLGDQRHRAASRPGGRRAS